MIISLIDCFYQCENRPKDPVTRKKLTVRMVFEKCFPDQAWPRSTFYDNRKRWTAATVTDQADAYHEAGQLWKAFAADHLIPGATVWVVIKRSQRSCSVETTESSGESSDGLSYQLGPRLKSKSLYYSKSDLPVQPLDPDVDGEDESLSDM
ncbi:uncharacterized protein ARMOST_00564 [Armillaria ostoyae]|uniref:Uncharacterized protein n=1 Tax=Armillaria ostoyae TaxID=47428 RepID=A0A284QLI3_ARMOS|nr:uncharacterized protein ARMOST_00564 [Armillaria ostoyae]